MGSRSFSLITVAAIVVTLVLVFIADTMIPPREQFIASPFAVPLLIAVNRLSVRGIIVTSIAVLAAAGTAAFLDSTPLIPALFELLGLLALGYLGILLARQRQVTARRAYDAEVERARVQTIFDSAPNAIAYVDARTGRVQGNPQTNLLFGRPLRPEAGVAQEIGWLRAPSGRSLTQEELPATRALRGETIAQEEEVVAGPNGAVTPVLESAAPVRGPAGETLGAVVIFQDITALKELERLREEWTSVIAHDLRQPITVILGYVDLLQRAIARQQSLDVAISHLGHLRSSAARLQKMVEDLLDVSRIEACRLTLQRQDVDLPSWVRAVVERMAVVTNGRPVSVSVKGDIPPVSADPVRIEQVLGNLLSNAVKYGYPQTDIRVELKLCGAMVEVSVTNRGPGIAPSELPELFNRFYRSKDARSGSVPGLGLGLYISRGLVEAHGGQIWAESVPGQQTTFHFTVPVASGETVRRSNTKNAGT